MASGLLAAYLVVGENQLKRETAIKRLRARLEGGLEAFNLDEMSASANLEPADVAISLNTLPVGTGIRLVLIHDANRIAKAVSETIIAYLENPNPDCVLCLDAQKLAKNTRLYKAVAKVGRQSVIDCTPVKSYKLPEHVAKHARALGMQLDIAAAKELISRVGEDMVLLDRQLRTLKELCDSPHVTQADVERYIARTAEVKPWEFLDKLAAGDIQRSLELYRHMTNASHHALVALIERRVRELICARSLMDRGQSARIASELKRQEWQVRSVVSAARHHTQESLIRCLSACETCERELKSGSDAETSFLTLLFAFGDSV